MKRGTKKDQLALDFSEPEASFQAESSDNMLDNQNTNLITNQETEMNASVTNSVLISQEILPQEIKNLLNQKVIHCFGYYRFSQEELQSIERYEKSILGYCQDELGKPAVLRNGILRWDSTGLMPKN